MHFPLMWRGRSCTRCFTWKEFPSTGTILILLGLQHPDRVWSPLRTLYEHRSNKITNHSSNRQLTENFTQHTATNAKGCFFSLRLLMQPKSRRSSTCCGCERLQCYIGNCLMSGFHCVFGEMGRIHIYGFCIWRLMHKNWWGFVYT